MPYEVLSWDEGDLLELLNHLRNCAECRELFQLVMAHRSQKQKVANKAAGIVYWPLISRYESTRQSMRANSFQSAKTAQGMLN